MAIREVGYCRHPDESVIASRITRQVFDEAGRLVESSDPRLWASEQKPNLATILGLSGQTLLTDSVDAGWQLSLLNQAGSLRSFWDARGSQRHIDYDDQQRPIAVTEQAADALSRVVERLTYGGSAPAFAVHNQCAKLIRHDNPASTRFVTDYGLAGAELSEKQCFLIDLEPPDWPIEVKARDALLEDQSFVTCHAFNATGEIRRQTDAMGNVRTFGYDVAGKLSETWLLMAGEGRQPQCLVSDIRYNAHDQIESEIAGNGVKTQAEYGADDGRLIRLVATVGSQKPLQDLHYVYDAVGNITELEDTAQTVTWFNNQRIEPINRYCYNSLSELVEAKGWEVANPSHGPALPGLLPTPLDPNQRRNYTQRFEYDAAGNLITRQHSGAPGFSMFTSARSNRSLAQRDDGSLPGESDIDSGFDACGNQLELQRGQAMTWDIRNQLSRVTLVKRDDEPDDYECYAYDRPGHRLRKVHFNQTRGRTGRTEVRYLPNLEIHRQSDGEMHHVISVEAGRCSVRALHWPEGAHADQLRYSLCDHLGSSTLELDHEAGVLTQEHYYPFGGTAYWAGKSAVVAKYKTIRYSGEERDATGLYYYGYRYYAPWLQRWMSPDPSGERAGLNRYCMVTNDPVNKYDFLGLSGVKANGEKKTKSKGDLEFFDKGLQEHFDSASEADKKSLEFVRNSMTHELFLDNSIQSRYLDDRFYNFYHKDKFVFCDNTRGSKTDKYYASHVVQVQYEMVARSSGFFGYLPTLMKRKSVINKQTLALTDNLVSASPEMLKVFLGETENGKSTARIMKVFRLEPWKVSRHQAASQWDEQGYEHRAPTSFKIYMRFKPEEKYKKQERRKTIGELSGVNTMGLSPLRNYQRRASL
ncbi:RHS repeat domain-containing protein [Pseudomonas migulae]|uniref:RHS repeat protein n=1 Tax=Pseudomonas migulae TaxID=78543 RepID=A0ABY8MVF8_9PSED|nr:RHS repeat-associated core domain-containing protein [Pseudomonas migulae]WGK90798.1 RHS repeat protein [Pseudomonas migulae]